MTEIVTATMGEIPREVALAASADNSGILYDFLYKFKEIGPSTGRHLAVGHGKPKQMDFMKVIAKMYKDSEMVYCDQNQSFIGGMLLNPFRNYLGKKRGILPANVVLDSNPTGDFVSGSGFFALHESSTPEERQEVFVDVYELLSEGALFAAVDYDLKHMRGYAEIERYMRMVFNTENEIAVSNEEVDWVEAHSRFGLDDCVREAEAAGFQTVYTDVRNRKLFLYLGRKN